MNYASTAGTLLLTQAQTAVSLVAIHFFLRISLSWHKSVQERLIEVSKWEYFEQYSLKPRVYVKFITINVTC